MGDLRLSSEIRAEFLGEMMKGGKEERLEENGGKCKWQMIISIIRGVRIQKRRLA